MNTMQVLALVFFIVGAITVLLIFWLALSAPTEEDADAADTDRAALDSIRDAVQQEPERRKVRAIP